MTYERAAEIIANEIKCVENADCERAECRECSLVMPSEEILEAYYLALTVLLHCGFLVHRYGPKGDE